MISFFEVGNFWVNQPLIFQRTKALVGRVPWSVASPQVVAPPTQHLGRQIDDAVILE